MCAHLLLRLRSHGVTKSFRLRLPFHLLFGQPIGSSLLGRQPLLRMSESSQVKSRHVTSRHVTGSCRWWVGIQRSSREHAMHLVRIGYTWLTVISFSIMPC